MTVGDRSQRLAAIQWQQPEWAPPSVLPLVSALIESTVEVRNLAGLVLDDSVYRSREDHVLAALVPEFRPPIDRYYASKGPRLRSRFNAGDLHTIDEVVARHLATLVSVWVQIEKQVYANEGTTRDAVACFRTVVEQTRLFS